MHPLRSLALASLLAALIPTTVAAQPVVYTNRTAWENAVRAAGIPLTTIDFEGIVLGSRLVCRSQRASHKPE